MAVKKPDTKKRWVIINLESGIAKLNWCSTSSIIGIRARKNREQKHIAFSAHVNLKDLTACSILFI